MSNREVERNEELIHNYFENIDPRILNLYRNFFAQIQTGGTAGFQHREWLESSGEETSVHASIFERRIHLRLPPIAGQFQDFVDRLILLETNIANLTEEIKSLKVELSERPQVFSLLLNELAEGKVDVVRPISLIVEETDEEVLVRWPDTRVYGSGDTLSEALVDIKNHIVEGFLDLRSRDPGSLGEIAIYTLKIFDSHLQINR